MPSKEYTQQVLSELVKRGNNADEIGKALDAMGADDQYKFIQQAGAKLGISEQALPEKRGLRFTSDNPSTSSMEARARGFEQQNPLADEAAGVGSAIASVLDPNTGKPLLQRVSEGYQQGKQSEKQDIAQAEQERPLEFQQGQGLGFAANIAGPAKFAKSAPILAPAIQGAVEGFGQGEGLYDSLYQAAKGLTIGAGLGASLKKAASLSQTGENLQQSARDKAVSLLNLPKGDLAPKEGINKAAKNLENLGRVLVEGKFTTPGTLRQVATRVDKETGNVGKALGDLYGSLDNSAANLSPQILADDLGERLSQTESVATLKDADSAVKAVIERGQKLMSELRKDKLSLKDTWEIAKRLENEGRVFTAADAVTEGTVYREAAKALRNQIQDRAANLSPANVNEISQLGRQYSMLSDANHALQSRVNINRFKQTAFTPSHGVAQKVFSTTVGSTPVRTSLITLQDRVGRMLQKGKLPAGVIKRVAEAYARGPQAIATTHFILQQQSPEYQQAMQEEADNESK